MPQDRAWTLLDSPRELRVEDYEAALLRLAERLDVTPGVEALYSFGSVGAPGISDLDTVIVVGARAADFADGQLTPEARDTDGKYLFMHPPFVMTREMVPGLRLQYGDVRLHEWRAAGMTPSVVEIATQSVAERLIVLLDFTLSLLVTFVEVGLTRRVRVRPTLCLLHSCGHTIRHGAAAGVPLSQDAHEFVEQVARLRAGWFTTARRERERLLISCVERASGILWEVLYSADRQLLRDVLNPRVEERRGHRHGYVFAYGSKCFLVPTGEESPASPSEWSYSRSVDADGAVWKRVRSRMVIAVPQRLCLHLALYADSGGAYGEGIRRRFVGRVPRYVCNDSSYEDGARLKVQLANQQAELLAGVGTTVGHLFLEALAPPRSRGWRRIYERLVGLYWRTALQEQTRAT